MSSAMAALKPAALLAASSASTRALRRPSSSPNSSPRHGAGVADEAGLGDHRGDGRDAADHVPVAQHADQAGLGVDAVLQGDHAGGPGRPVGLQERGAGGAGALHVPQLGGEEHDVDRSDLGRIVGGVGGRDLNVAVGAGDAEPLFPDRLQVSAAGDEGDIAAGGGEPGAEIAADPARAHHRDLHGDRFGHGTFLMGRGMECAS